MWLSQPPTQKASVEEAADEDVSHHGAQLPCAIRLNPGTGRHQTPYGGVGGGCGSALNKKKFLYLYIVNFSWKTPNLHSLLAAASANLNHGVVQLNAQL